MLHLIITANNVAVSKEKAHCTSANLRVSELTSKSAALYSSFESAYNGKSLLLTASAHPFLLAHLVKSTCRIRGSFLHRLIGQTLIILFCPFLFLLVGCLLYFFLVRKLAAESMCGAAEGADYIRSIMLCTMFDRFS